jgi:23S rRNA pseudouridine955/2504/2580 synthase
MDKLSNRTIYKVHSEYNDQRLDNFLIRELKGIPKSLLYKLIRKSKIKVNNKKSSPSYRLITDDEILVFGQAAASNTLPSMASSQNKCFAWLEEHIIHEDSEVIVFNKPPGLAVHAGTGDFHGLIEMLRIQRPELKALDLVHRLDKLTSGCLLVAKKRSSLRAFHEIFRERQVIKEYVAVVHGKWDLGDYRIELGLERTKHSGLTRSVISKEGKPSVTQVKVIARNPRLSFLRIQLETGRLHQIRAHLSHLNFPIVGDPIYAGNEARLNKGQYDLKSRMYLHSKSLSFLEGRTTNIPKDLVAPMSDDFIKLLQRESLMG